ncbi:ABC transporter substrate-binding protein [Wansuia hejianensis]|uniref:ABC transporter substrate-binding protein n=1 Tax=Wansuia hejianensis TaxID=2763667 RepID=A0A926F1U3_9FIRM|nr:ABC transporter substrate-binding protein [Wansuia hejianensis]MBC8591497.1 ABC transporter substrate-binding protein [Wansuia hejianensis]
MRKKGIVLLLILSLVLSTFLVACTPKDKDTGNNTDTPSGKDEPSDKPSGAPEEPTGEVKIGNKTDLSGDWVPYWTNNAADYDVYNFIMGLSTVDMTPEGEYFIDESVVANSEVKENEDGSKTYTFTIKDGLKYADGTEITAKDYVAHVMFWSSNQLQTLEAKADAGYYYVGYGDFNSGKSKVFPGVRLLGDMEFSVTIAAEHVPYYFELPNVSIMPLNLAYWTDDTVEIKDDGEGCYFSDNFKPEDYKDKINEARFGVEDFPATGPYKLVSYDTSARTAVMEVNENYPGNYEGQKPKIKTVIYKKVTDETALDELATGGVDVLPGLASGEEINAGMDLVDKGGIEFNEYPRSGYGKLMFQCDFGPTQFVEVRQAIAHLLDRNEFAKSFTGGFGTVVNGPYGESMWFYQETKAELNEKLNQYPYSLDEAKKLLEEGGWVYDANGKEYKEGIRHKKLDDGTLMPLVIEWASTEDNEVSDLLVVSLQENEDLASAGIEIKQTTMDFEELLNWMYRDGSKDPKYSVPTFGMYNLATNYTPRYDLSTTYTTDEAMLKAGYNTNFILDEELEKAAKSMVLTEPGDNEAFKEKFVTFIERWNELLPDLPLYSNLYHDFFNEKLENFEMNSLIRISDAILYAYVTE